jgi:hypothetical protein
MQCYQCGMDVQKCERCAVCGFQVCNAYVETLVKTLTAFQDFNDMVQAMNTGYVPTIRPVGKRSKFLMNFILGMGFRVFNGRRTL